MKLFLPGLMDYTDNLWRARFAGRSKRRRSCQISSDFSCLCEMNFLFVSKENYSGKSALLQSQVGSKIANKIGSFSRKIAKISQPARAAEGDSERPSDSA
jgi:hypothetical protein